MSFLKTWVIFHSSVSLLAQTLHTFHNSSPSRCKFSTAQFTKFLMSFFKYKVSFSSKFRSCFSAMKDNSVLFALKLCMPLAKVAHQSAKFQTCHLLTLKFTKFHMSFLEPSVSFSSIFASLFSVMRHNSSVLFCLNICMLCTNGSNQSTNFRTFNCSHEN